MTSETKWVMPRPEQGELVLFSNDIHNFTAPCIGWVMKEPGHATVQLLVFTELNGWLVKPSVHHRDDPALKGDHNWDGLGVWDFPKSKQSSAAEKPQETTKGKFFGRETAAR